MAAGEDPTRGAEGGAKRLRLGVSIWKGRVAPVFDVSRRLVLAEVEDGRLVGSTDHSMDDLDPSRRADRVRALGVQVLICGAVSMPLAAMLESRGITVIPFISGEQERVLAACIEDRLSSDEFLMPGCCGARRWGRGPGGRRRDRRRGRGPEGGP